MKQEKNFKVKTSLFFLISSFYIFIILINLFFILYYFASQVKVEFKNIYIFELQNKTKILSKKTWYLAILRI